MNKEELIELFYEYVKEFDLTDKSIMRKYNHSLRVMEYSIEIA